MRLATAAAYDILYVVRQTEFNPLAPDYRVSPHNL
jgi:hypothetical protein